MMAVAAAAVGHRVAAAEGRPAAAAAHLAQSLGQWLTAAILPGSVLLESAIKQACQPGPWVPFNMKFVARSAAKASARLASSSTVAFELARRGARAPRWSSPPASMASWRVILATPRFLRVCLGRMLPLLRRAGGSC